MKFEPNKTKKNGYNEPPSEPRPPAPPSTGGYKMRFEKTEHEKISNELLNKLIPMDVLNSYYLFGYAEALKIFNDVFNQLDFYDERDKENLLETIKLMCDQCSEVKSYYERLQGDSKKHHF